jgi:uncharacterized damage-inducible protein DinB
VAEDFAGLARYRKLLDVAITAWSVEVSDDDLTQPLHYRSTGGQALTKNYHALVMHFFNHQTHHRGQATTLLTQAGVDVGDTDLSLLVPEQA